MIQSFLEPISMRAWNNLRMIFEKLKASVMIQSADDFSIKVSAMVDCLGGIETATKVMVLREWVSQNGRKNFNRGI
jgi:hypothetical protein